MARTSKSQGVVYEFSFSFSKAKYLRFKGKAPAHRFTAKHLMPPYGANEWPGVMCTVSLAHGDRRAKVSVMNGTSDPDKIRTAIERAVRQVLEDGRAWSVTNIVREILMYVWVDAKRFFASKAASQARKEVDSTDERKTAIEEMVRMWVLRAGVLRAGDEKRIRSLAEERLRERDVRKVMES